RARPLRGKTNPAYPSGMATAMPVGTSARPPQGRNTTSSRATRSAPASPECAYDGSSRSGSRRCTGTSTEGGEPRFASVLVWMDLEMTGLDPAQHTIVEIACLVTDDDLELVAEGPDIVVYQPPEALAAMDTVVRAMHSESGLLAEVERSTVSLTDAG